MTERGVVFDLGYAPHEGERRGRRGAIATTYRDGLFRVFGIHRRARKKILPWLLVIFAILPALVFVGFAFLLATFAPEAESPFGSHAEYFGITASVVLLFVALGAPELLIPDRREGVLAVYSSRPLRPDDYVGTRTASLLTVIAGFMLIPQVLMYVGFAALSSDGFFRALGTNADEIPRILAAAAVYALAYAPVGLLISTIASRKAAATGIFFGVMLVGTALAAALVEATGVPGHRFAALLGLAEHPTQVSDWIFGRVGSSDLVVARTGFDPWVSLVVVLVVAGVSSTIVVWRYRRIM
jgi:ABC-2 type transport system permease protein